MCRLLELRCKSRVSGWKNEQMSRDEMMANALGTDEAIGRKEEKEDRVEWWFHLFEWDSQRDR